MIRGRSAAAVAQSVEDAVHGGQLAPGASLPTVRQLARTLAISPATVAAAYRLLRARGLVLGAGRAGTRVAPRPPSPAAGRAAPMPAGLIDLSSGNPDPALLPPLDSGLRAVHAAPHLYGATPALPVLMRFLAADLEADGIAGALTLASGSLDAMERVLREHLRPGDVVAVEDPTLPSILDLLAVSGYRRAPIAVDEEGPRPEAMDAALRSASAVIVTTRAHNPTGAALVHDRVKELRRVLRKRPRVLLIENDPGGPIAGLPCVPLTGTDLKVGPSTAPWAFIRPTSKFLGPDLRLAVVAGDARTIARVEGRYALGARWVSTILQQLVLALWSDPGNARLIARAADLYAQRRGALVRALAAHGIVARGRSGFNVWVPVRHESAVVAHLAEAGWGVAAGERFRLEADPGIRITTSSLLPADADRLAADLAALAPMGYSRAAAC